MKKTRSLDHDGLDGIIPSAAKARSKADIASVKSDKLPAKSSRGKVVWLFTGLGSLLVGGFLLQAVLQNPSSMSSQLASAGDSSGSVPPGRNTPLVPAPEQRSDQATDAAPPVADSTPKVVAMAEQQDLSDAEAAANPIPGSDKQQPVELPTEPTGAGIAKSPVLNGGQPDAMAPFTVYFKFDSSKLTLASANSANELLSAAKNCQSLIKLNGHTCNLGSDAANLQLGLMRANAVKKLLLAKGIGATAIITASEGMRKPVAPNDTKEGQALNRRVELQCVDN
ncbi:OmpA family protein [Methylomonas albis]|uniref:OmpA family protein n=1 Tax=Methylomonas albis TaxID=1854563 RepID=A0ABR9D211_9GAMM|nr:OmpA family protein [Methylomonas albis]MBD9357155.1 OmpA family protein [Methylomonas albis]